MEEQKKIILITGGAGFIGSHLCEKYLDEGHRIICVDNLQTTFKPKNIERFLSNKNFKFQKNLLRKKLRKPKNRKLRKNKPKNNLKKRQKSQEGTSQGKRKMFF